jgi:hypothetical protein
MKALTAVFVQHGIELLRFEKEDMVLTDSEASFTLSVEDTMRFSPSIPAELQLRAESEDGKVTVSDIRTIAVRKKYPEDALPEF